MQFYSSFVTLSLFVKSLTSEPSVTVDRHRAIDSLSSTVQLDTVIRSTTSAATHLSVAQRSDPGLTDPTIALIDLHDIIPAGWRRTNAFQLDAVSGPPTMWLIGRYDHLPVGSTFVMLADDPIPSGWELTTPSATTHDFQKTIIRRR